MKMLCKQAESNLFSSLEVYQLPRSGDAAGCDVQARAAAGIVEKYGGGAAGGIGLYRRAPEERTAAVGIGGQFQSVIARTEKLAGLSIALHAARLHAFARLEAGKLRVEVDVDKIIIILAAAQPHVCNSSLLGYYCHRLHLLCQKVLKNRICKGIIVIVERHFCHTAPKAQAIIADSGHGIII